MVKPWLGGALLAFLAVAPAGAESYKLGDLELREPWARATAPMQKNGAAYLTIVNHGAAPDRLVAVEGNVAGSVELHSSAVDAQGVATMRPVEGGIEVPAGGEARLEPGGLHIMMMGLQAPLAQGASFPLGLRFEKAGAVTVQVEVRVAGAAAGAHGSHDAHGAHKAH